VPGICKLLEESAIRGVHSFGFYGPGGTSKHHRLAEAVKQMPMAPFIFHNRYSTSGDWDDHNNNQPIISGSVGMAFNGTLDMRTKEEMEAAHGVKMRTYNDGELALLAYLKGGDRGLMDFIEETGGSFAGVFLEPGRLFAYRNTKRPLWVVDEGSLAVIASTQDILSRAGFNGAEELEAGEIHSWTL